MTLAKNLRTSVGIEPMTSQSCTWCDALRVRYVQLGVLGADMVNTSLKPMYAGVSKGPLMY